jgi:hypothetical protein
VNVLLVAPYGRYDKHYQAAQQLQDYFGTDAKESESEAGKAVGSPATDPDKKEVKAFMAKIRQQCVRIPEHVSPPSYDDKPAIEGSKPMSVDVFAAYLRTVQHAKAHATQL